jgi:hypothetical protein
MAGLTPDASRRTFDTAARETPADRATSLMVTARFAGLVVTLDCKSFLRSTAGVRTD